jgi:acetyl esterase
MTDAIVLDGLTLHPEMQFLLDIRRKRAMPALPDMSLAEIRAHTLRDAITGGGEPTPVGSVRDTTVDGATGPLRARHYLPPGGASDLLVFFHGGGFVFGDVDSHDAPCRLLCATGGFAVLSVEYRLAPEHPHPAAIEDAWAAWQWVVAHVGELGAQQLGVGGDSAGGMLAAAVCQLAARSGIRAPALQLLIYPAISRDPAAASMRLFGDDFFFTRAEMDFFERSLRGDAPADPTDYRAYPLAGDLSGLAPALVVTAGFDPLRDGAEAYATALNAAGTPAILRRYDSLIHGVINMIGFSPACRAATTEIAEQTAALFRA